MSEDDGLKAMGQVIQIDEARIRDQRAAGCRSRSAVRCRALRTNRAGSYERSLHTVAGEVNLKVPKLRRQTIEAIAHPTDARLTHRAIEKLVALAKREGVDLRQSYLRVAKCAAITVERYTHAHQFKRARRELKFLRVRLGRIIRDIRRQIEGDPALEDRFGPLLDLARRVRLQEQRQRGPKVYSLHALEVECIGKGKARAPYEFGCKVSIVSPVTAPKGGQFVLHAKALHGNPYDGHTLGPVIPDLESLIKGYRGHKYPDRFKVWISGQVRRVTKTIRREMRRRAAVEPVNRPSQGRPPDAPATISRGATATASTPCSPLPVTTSACSCDGSQNFCASCY